ncbi:hypothetical protein [Halarcobacter bivalviorum]|uniref:hypothetical protein n=1 Tax=Halarcobacter bivalviorum TaxID=663364 RepID=UPI00100B14DF|nr:hypothetical protein [Halarcobacter bivalviorum]RXK06544.1 hypothetical protein CRU97_04795 [Halarcobacter bivalviorum]
MSIKILTAKENPHVAKLKNEFDIFRVLDIKKGKLEIIEFFNKDGVFRGFGKDTKSAFKKAKKVLKNYYS